MYLTRIFIDEKCAAVRADLRSPTGLHRTIMRAFPSDLGERPRKKLSVLYRVDSDRDGRLAILVQSLEVPDTSTWPVGYVLSPDHDLDLALGSLDENPATRDLRVDHERFAPGRAFMFRLLANTTRKINTKSGADGARRNGQRVPVRGLEARIGWLRRRSEMAGFQTDEGSLRAVEVSPVGARGSVTLAGTLFEGSLRIRDVEAFRGAVREGIGPGKAYGFGLLSLGRARD